MRKTTASTRQWVRQRHLWLRPGDRGRRLFRHARWVRLCAGSGHRQGKVAAGYAGQDVPRCSRAERDVSPRPSWPTARSWSQEGPRTGDPVVAAQVRRVSPVAVSSWPWSRNRARIAWKYDVGPKPEPLRPADHDQGCLGRARLPLWSRDQHGLVHAVVSCGFADHFLRHRHQQRAAATHHGRSPPRHPPCLRRDRHRRPRRLGEMGDANQPRGRLERQHEGLRSQDRSLPGPVDRRHPQDFHDPRGTGRRPSWSGLAARTAGFTSCGLRTA